MQITRSFTFFINAKNIWLSTHTIYFAIVSIQLDRKCVTQHAHRLMQIQTANNIHILRRRRKQKQNRLNSMSPNEIFAQWICDLIYFTSFLLLARTSLHWIVDTRISGSVLQISVSEVNTKKGISIDIQRAYFRFQCLATDDDYEYMPMIDCVVGLILSAF